MVFPGPALFYIAAGNRTRRYWSLGTGLSVALDDFAPSADHGLVPRARKRPRPSPHCRLIGTRVGHERFSAYAMKAQAKPKEDRWTCGIDGHIVTPRS